MPVIRPYRPSDRAAVSEICVRTADAGADATGMLSDDALWGDLFAVPYVVRHPDLAWVVESDDGRTIGYIVATDDTDAFFAWFRDVWWPAFRETRPRPAEAKSREEKLIEYGYGRAPGLDAATTADYPAHLHIDLLPETQGKGLGRALIETLFAELRRRGVRGLHLGMDPANSGAAAFYERIGLVRLAESADGLTYGISFS